MFLIGWSLALRLSLKTQGLLLVISSEDRLFS